MDRVLVVSLFAFLSLCQGLASPRTFVDEEHGKEGDEGLSGSVSKHEGAFEYAVGSVKGTV